MAPSFISMSSDKTHSSTRGDDAQSVERPPEGAVVCEEASDEGSLLKGFSVWRSGLVFSPKTSVRRSNDVANSSKDNQPEQSPLAGRTPPAEPHRASHHMPYARGDRKLQPSLDAAIEDSGKAVPGLASSQEGPKLSIGLPSVDETSESVCSEIGKVMRSHDSTSVMNIGDNGSTLRIESPCSTSKNQEYCTSALGMGSFEGINPFHSADDRADDHSLSLYTRTAAMDSKYQRYNVDVDPLQGDRAADIALFSYSRPHMRGFHLAWMAFFVSFFTWFAMTPLLSEIARSLDLSRQEIFISNVLAVVSSAVTRILMGPLNDFYGARWMMCLTLVAAAIPTALASLMQSKTGFYMVRLFTGIAGSSFVTCQYWTLSMFTKEIAGTANALAAGWGNLGGGVAQVVMGSLLFPIAKLAFGGECFGSCGSDDADDELEFDRPSDLAWRTILLFPAILSCVMAYVVMKYGDDTPKGDAPYRLIGTRNISHSVPPSPVMTVWENFKQGISNRNALMLSFQYGCCFGVEITMTQVAALYFSDEFAQSTESAAAIASVFGWMNIFARGIGGFCSDWANARSGLRGRLWCQVVFLVTEGCLVILFSRTRTLGGSIAVMVIFSIFVQAAEGSTFDIVSYIDSTVVGSVTGLVGAGGSIGGACFAFIFLRHSYTTSFHWIGFAVLTSALWSVFFDIPGHRGLCCGRDSSAVVEHRNRAKPPAIIVIRMDAMVRDNKDSDDDEEEPSIRNPIPNAEDVKESA